MQTLKSFYKEESKKSFSKYQSSRLRHTLIDGRLIVKVISINQYICQLCALNLPMESLDLISSLIRVLVHR